MGYEPPDARDNQKLVNIIEAIIRLCEQNGVSLSHEDDHGGFKFVPFSEANSEWLRAASDETGSSQGW